jgi:hypothetical protein
MKLNVEWECPLFLAERITKLIILLLFRPFKFGVTSSQKQKPNHRVRLSCLLSSILVMRRPISRLIFLTCVNILLLDDK